MKLEEQHLHGASQEAGVSPGHECSNQARIHWVSVHAGVDLSSLQPTYSNPEMAFMGRWDSNALGCS